MTAPAIALLHRLVDAWDDWQRHESDPLSVDATLAANWMCLVSAIRDARALLDADIEASVDACLSG